MLSKEEIEKAKEDSKDIIYELNKHKDADFIGRLYYRNKPIEDILQTLLQHIDQLECENKTLNQKNKSYKGMLNKQNKIIDEMAEFIVSSAIADDTVCSRIFCEVEGDCSHKKMLKCTKQYFKKKAELLILV